MSQDFFKIRGVVEGFYGVYYTFPERIDLIQFLGQHGFNFYIYGPKNDRQHRNRWREPYPDNIRQGFRATVTAARKAGVEFCYALSPISMWYSGDGDFSLILEKFSAFHELGVRTFSLFLDDIAHEFPAEEDRKRYRSFAGAHVDICNRVYHRLKTLDRDCSLSMCPTDYHGRAPFSDYLRELGEGLHPEIDIFYTGSEVCSKEILTGEARDFAAVAKRLPVIWDNYPVNDLSMQKEMHIGPVRGREASLYESVKGILINTMIQPEASKIPLLTFADYFRDPHSYDPDVSWNLALRTIGGDEYFNSLYLFAENSLKSCLEDAETKKLEVITNEVLRVLRPDAPLLENPAVTALENYLTEMDESCYRLRNRMENLSLRHDLLPWLELLEQWSWVGRRAFMILKAKAAGERFDEPARLLQESLSIIDCHHKRYGAQVLHPLAQYALDQARQTVGIKNSTLYSIDGKR